MSLRSMYASSPGAVPSAFAMGGVVIIDNTATHTGNFYHTEVKTNCVIDTATLASNVSGSITGKAYAAGTMLRFGITSIKLTSGEVHAYKA